MASYICTFNFEFETFSFSIFARFENKDFTFLCIVDETFTCFCFYIYSYTMFSDFEVMSIFIKNKTCYLTILSYSRILLYVLF